MNALVYLSRCGDDLTHSALLSSCLVVHWLQGFPPLECAHPCLPVAGANYHMHELMNLSNLRNKIRSLMMPSMVLMKSCMWVVSIGWTTRDRSRLL